MRVLLPLSFLLALADPSCAEEPKNTAPQPPCEALLQAPRPEEPEAAALWDKCRPADAGAPVIVPGAPGYDVQAARMEEVSGEAQIQARKRIGSLANPFADGQAAGTLTAGGADGGAKDLASVPSAWTRSVGAGGPAHLNDRPVPPLTRIDQAFAALEPAGGPGAWLAANAAYRAVVPALPFTSNDWTTWTRGMGLPNLGQAPKPFNLTTPATTGAVKIPAKFVVTEPVSAPPSIGGGLTSGGAKNKLGDAIPTAKIKGMASGSFFAALGATWLHGVTVDVTPGDKDKRIDRSVSTRIDVGQGNMKLFGEVGVEDHYTRTQTGYTAKHKAVFVNGKDTNVPWRVGATWALGDDPKR